MWQWDVDNDICAICRIIILEPCLNVSFCHFSFDFLPLYQCQADAGKSEECAVVWGECSHTFHHCCLARWLLQVIYWRKHGSEYNNQLLRQIDAHFANKNGESLESANEHTFHLFNHYHQNKLSHDKCFY